MATTKVMDSKQKKLTTPTPTPTPSDGRRQTTKPSPSSSTRSSRSTSPNSPKRGRPTAPSTGAKPLPNYLKHTESSRTTSARLMDSSNKLHKKHTTATTATTTTTTTGHETKASSNRRRSIDRSTPSSALSSSQVHSKNVTLTTRSTTFASRPTPASHRVLPSKAPKSTIAASSNKSHSSSGSGKSAPKKTTATFKKENLDIESSNALEKASVVADIGNEQTLITEAIEEPKEVEQNKVGESREEIVQELEIPDYPESEEIIETEIENTKDDILEPVEESDDADRIEQTKETKEEEKILEPDDNNGNHEDNGEELDDAKDENKDVSPPVKSSFKEETESEAEDNHKEDTDEKLDQVVWKEENSVAVVDEDKAESCKEKEGVAAAEVESPALKSVAEEEPPKTSTDTSKGTGKKDSPAYNDVIEETASKLLEKRKNKVKALVGAFETVISLDAN